MAFRPAITGELLNSPRTARTRKQIKKGKHQFLHPCQTSATKFDYSSYTLAFTVLPSFTNKQLGAGNRCIEPSIASNLASSKAAIHVSMSKFCSALLCLLSSLGRVLYTCLSAWSTKVAARHFISKRALLYPVCIYRWAESGGIIYPVCRR